jgi:hypothetical protein
MFRACAETAGFFAFCQTTSPMTRRFVMFVEEPLIALPITAGIRSFTFSRHKKLEEDPQRT